jgi:hypothetical protein
MKRLIGIISISFLALVSAQSQVQTIVVGSGSVVSNTVWGSMYMGSVLTIASNYCATLKSVGGNGMVIMNTQGISTEIDVGTVVAGPATFQVTQTSASSSLTGFATISVEPAPFPPGKTVTVGAYSGNVQVTMQMSTDLVNWTTAVNGQVYTNSPDARFFRIQMVTNAQP